MRQKLSHILDWWCSSILVHKSWINTYFFLYDVEKLNCAKSFVLMLQLHPCKKITFYTEIFIWKVDLLIFSLVSVLKKDDIFFFSSSNINVTSHNNVNTLFRKKEFYAWWNDQVKCFKICHIFGIQKPT